MIQGGSMSERTGSGTRDRLERERAFTMQQGAPGDLYHNRTGDDPS